MVVTVHEPYWVAVCDSIGVVSIVFFSVIRGGIVVRIVSNYGTDYRLMSLPLLFWLAGLVNRLYRFVLGQNSESKDDLFRTVYLVTSKAMGFYGRCVAILAVLY